MIQLFLCSRKCWMVLCWSRLNTLFNNYCRKHACSHQAEKVNMASIIYINCEVLVLLLVQCWNRLNGLRTTLFLRPTFAKHPFNFCWTNVGQMLKWALTWPKWLCLSWFCWGEGGGVLIEIRVNRACMVFSNTANWKFVIGNNIAKEGSCKNHKAMTIIMVTFVDMQNQLVS